jgi:hypothetical protein
MVTRAEAPDDLLVCQERASARGFSDPVALMGLQRLLELGRLLSEPLAGEHCETRALEV